MIFPGTAPFCGYCCSILVDGTGMRTLTRVTLCKHRNVRNSRVCRFGLACLTAYVRISWLFKHADCMLFLMNCILCFTPGQWHLRRGCAGWKKGWLCWCVFANSCSGCWNASKYLANFASVESATVTASRLEGGDWNLLYLRELWSERRWSRLPQYALWIGKCLESHLFGQENLRYRIGAAFWAGQTCRRMCWVATRCPSLRLFVRVPGVKPDSVV